MTPYVRPFFSKSFYKQDIASAAPSSSSSSAPPPSSSSPVPSSPRAQTASKPVFFSEARYAQMSLSEMMALEGFPECQRQYMALLDRLTGFVDTHADQVKPPLTRKTTNAIKAHIDLLKNNLKTEALGIFDLGRNLIYGSTKAMFHKLDDLLADQRLSLDRRMQAVQKLAPSLGTCAGGITSAVQDAVAELRPNVSGIKGAAYRTKLHMLQGPIQEHVRTSHPKINPGNEVHYVNAYFNHIAAEMGVPKQDDPNISDFIIKDINAAQLAQCRNAIVAKLKPGALATALADTYLDKIKGALSNAGISTKEVLEKPILAADFEVIDNIKMATLTPDFGEVPIGKFMTSADNNYEGFKIAPHSLDVARHFMEELKKSELVNYNDAVAIPLNDGRGKLVVLDNLMWRDNDGQCTPVGAADLLKIAPGDVARAMGPKTGRTAQERDLVLKTLIMEMLDADQSQDSAVAWMGQCASLLERIVAEDDPWATPVLQTASLQNNVELVQNMIDAGANVNMRSANGTTAAMCAAGYGNDKALEKLIKADKTTVNLQDKAGFTAAMHAVRNGQTAALKILLKANPATVSVEDNIGRTAAMHAANKGRADALKMLIDVNPATVDAEDKKRRTATMYAANKGYVEVVNTLIAAGANLNMRDANHFTATMHAAKNGHGAVVNILTKAQADRDAQNRNSLTVRQVLAQWRNGSPDGSP